MLLYLLNVWLYLQNFGLEYERYLKEVVNVLESDEGFKKKLEESNISDIKVTQRPIGLPVPCIEQFVIVPNLAWYCMVCFDSLLAADCVHIFVVLSKTQEQCWQLWFRWIVENFDFGGN